MSRLLDYLYTRHEQMIETLGRLVMIESPSDEREAVDEVAAFMAQGLGALGAQVERLPQVTFGDHLRAVWGGGPGQILILGHMDTVWPLGETKDRPFEIDGDRATGPGVFDMKGGLVVGLYALEALRALDLTPGRRLVFVLNADEEWGSPTSRPLIEEEGRRSDAALVLEPSREDALVVWRKGIGRFEMEVQGLASHAGAAHARGVSAVQELAHQVLQLEAMTDYSQGTTINVGKVQGGSKVNVRPAAAWAEIDLRVTTAQEGERMVEAIRGLRPVNPDASLVIAGHINRPPWEPSPQCQALFERAQQVGQALGLDLAPAGSGGGSDGNFTAALGVPTLDGLGPVGDEAHALTEWVDLTSLPVRAALLAELILDLGR
jgi:glutamate carboxypeptidase